MPAVAGNDGERLPTGFHFSRAIQLDHKSGLGMLAQMRVIRENAIANEGHHVWAFLQPDVESNSTGIGGEVFRLIDTDQDSQSVGLQWRAIGENQAGLCYHGYGQLPEDNGFKHYCDIGNIREGTVIVYRVGRCNQSRWGNCNTSLLNWTDWSPNRSEAPNPYSRSTWDDRNLINDTFE
jgi:hypothetical protein